MPRATSADRASTGRAPRPRLRTSQAAPSLDRRAEVRARPAPEPEVDVADAAAGLRFAEPRHAAQLLSERLSFGYRACRRDFFFLPRI